MFLLNLFNNFFDENTEIFLKYQNFYLNELLKINKSLSKAKEDFTFALSINHHEALTKTILYYIENEINPRVDSLQKLKNNFYIKLYLDTISPKNFPFLDKNFIKFSEEQNYQNLINGFKNFLIDISDNHFDHACGGKYIIGKTLAFTKGKIIFQNELLELIAYEPKDQINSIPILLTPACINKYYIFDLQEQNSLIKWLRDNNYQVFVISWINPERVNPKINFTFSDYIDSVEMIIEKIISEFKFEKIHLVGYCLGGLFTAITASILKSKNKNYLKSLTFLTTQLDFSEPNNFSIFLEPLSWEMIKFKVSQTNSMDGLSMHSFFNYIKAKEMIFQYIIDQYYYNQQKCTIDFIAWNDDPTNLTSNFYIEYIESTYINDLIAKGNMKINDFKIDLSQIDTPTYFLATENDHIVPWKDSYRSLQLFKNSKKRFVLGGSGHVAGVINPPINQKYKYFTNDEKIEAHYDIWKSEAKEFKGSWWNDWLKWMNDQNNKTITNNYNSMSSVSDAPGEFVKKSC
jgi:polyhydroxyalkanoate synthase